MRHHDSDPHNALNDYLDALAGAPPADSRAGDLDPDLRDGVDRFFDLAEQAGLDPRASTRTESPTMSTNLTLPASGAFIPSTEETRRSLPLPSMQMLHLASTALLIVTVIALAVALFGANGIGRNGEGDPNGNFAAVPLATVEPDTESSSIPYPTIAECTVEPMTRDELIAHIEAGNVAAAPRYQQYERPIEPSAEDADAIMQTYRKWQACSLVGGGIQYLARLQTPWFTANGSGLFWSEEENGRSGPASEADIESYVDRVLSSEPDPAALAHASPVAASPPAIPQEDVNRLPLPDGATPVAFTDDGPSFPTIFAEDIVVNGPNQAHASAYFVNPKTGEVSPSTVISLNFVKIDGQWLLNTYREGLAG